LLNPMLDTPALGRREVMTETLSKTNRYCCQTTTEVAELATRLEQDNYTNALTG